MSFKNFKEGDRVKLLRNVGCAKKGMIGTCVEDYFEDGSDCNIIPVKFDDEFEGGHDCGGRTIDGHGHWIYLGHLEKLDPPHAFTLVITSKGDHTEAKLLHGKEIVQTAEVNRYKDDEYSQPAAIHAIIDKMFPRNSAGITRDEPEEPPKFTGKAVFNGTDRYFTQGNVYTFESGTTIDDDTDKRGILPTDDDWKHWFEENFVVINNPEEL